MAASLQEQLGVAISGQHWNIGDITLMQSTDPNIILYLRKQPLLARDSGNGRYQSALSQFLHWQDDHYNVTGGSLLFTITSSVEYDIQKFQQLKERWRTVLLNTGYSGNPNPNFMPIPMRNGKFQVMMDPTSGKVNDAYSEGDSTTSGTATSIMIDLTEQGAQKWVQGIKRGDALPGGVKFTYEYPQMLPEVDASVTLHGLRVFTYLSRVLSRSDDGTLYGSSADIQSAWDDMVQSGDVEIKLVGNLPPDLDAKRQEMFTTFANQAKQQMFDTLFAPMPEITASQPGSNGGSAGGSNYALRWHKRSDASDLSMVIKFDAWNWLAGSMEVDCSTLFQGLDESYINTVYTQASVPVSLVVDPEPMVSSVAVSLTFSEGHPPEAAVFGKAGGTAQYMLTSTHPDAVTVGYKAKVSFVSPSWPVMEVSGTSTVAQGGNQIALKPGSWLRRLTFYMYIRDGNRIKKPNEAMADDDLTLNVVYQGSNSTPLIKESTHITPLAPVEFSYPVNPAGPAGQVKFSAFGDIGGQMMRSQELLINQDEEDVFILVTKDGIQLVSKQAVLGEDDRLAQRLLESGARPVVDSRGQQAESEKHSVLEGNKSASGSAISEDARSIEIDVEIELIPQPTPISCWAAALAMVVGARDRESYSPETIASAAGMDTNTPYGWSAIERAVTAWDLHETGPASAMPSEWARLLELWGPLWIVEVGAPYHAVVLAGMYGDGTPDSTQVTVYNPWPPNQGAIEYKTFLDFDNEFGLGAGASAMIVHA